MSTTPTHRSAQRRPAKQTRRVATALAAGPLAVLFTAAAAAAAPGDADRAAEIASGVAGEAASSCTEQQQAVPEVKWQSASVKSDGVLLTLDEEAGIFTTGALKGEVDLGLNPAGDRADADNLFLHKKKGSYSDFGDVTVMIGPVVPIEGRHCGSLPVIEFPTGVEFQVGRFPTESGSAGGEDAQSSIMDDSESGGDPISLVTDPFVLEPVHGESTEGIPTVNEPYKLEDSMSLYHWNADGDFVKVGALEEFTVVIKKTP